MKDWQFEGKSMVVAAGELKSMKIPAPDVAFLDKKFVLVSGTAIDNVSVMVGCGRVNIDICDFTTATYNLVRTAGTDHIIEIPMPCASIAITVDNSAGGSDVNVHFYGGSA